MPTTDMHVILIFLVTFQTLVAEAVLDGTCTGAGSACVDEPNAALCNNADSPACVCNINYVVSGTDCALITCTDGTSAPTTVCNGANTACTKDTSKCSCIANFKVVAATLTRCTQITCTTETASLCTGADANSYCLATDCVCKKNFVGTNLANCERQTCANDAACTEINSACHTVTNAGCGCDTLYTANATTGACSTQKTCTVATVTTACGTNTVCEESGSALLCFCQSNYKASVTGCVQKTCSSTDTANCDANSQCSSDNCVCADNFVINGRVCECPSTGFSLVGGMCKKTCNETSQCGTKGACSNSVCECEPNYEGNAATACTQKLCSGTNTTNCASKSLCESDKCVCTSGSFVADSNPLVCAGCEGIFCNFSLLMASLLMFFFCSKISE